MEEKIDAQIFYQYNLLKNILTQKYIVYYFDSRIKTKRFERLSKNSRNYLKKLRK